MNERPIIFSASMVRALLEGRKTQTRRLVKIKLHEGVNPNFSQLRAHREGDGWRIHGSQEASERFKAPYAVGDRLWVRETWSHDGAGVWTIADARMRISGKPFYRADDDRAGVGWWSSIFLPREFSRLTLVVTEVRVERLQDISEADAVAEGVEPEAEPLEGKVYFRNYEPRVLGSHLMPRASFSSLWTSLHGADAWDANPWVAAVTFEVHRANIDALPTPPVAPNLAQGGEL